MQMDKFQCLHFIILSWLASAAEKMMIGLDFWHFSFTYLKASHEVVMNLKPAIFSKFIFYIQPFKLYWSFQIHDYIPLIHAILIKLPIIFLFSSCTCNDFWKKSAEKGILLSGWTFVWGHKHRMCACFARI